MTPLILVLSASVAAAFFLFQKKEAEASTPKKAAEAGAKIVENTESGAESDAHTDKGEEATQTVITEPVRRSTENESKMEDLRTRRDEGRAAILGGKQTSAIGTLPPAKTIGTWHAEEERTAISTEVNDLADAQPINPPPYAHPVRNGTKKSVIGKGKKTIRAPLKAYEAPTQRLTSERIVNKADAGEENAVPDEDVGTCREPTYYERVAAIEKEVEALEVYTPIGPFSVIQKKKKRGRKSGHKKSKKSSRQKTKRKSRAEEAKSNASNQDEAKVKADKAVDKESKKGSVKKESKRKYKKKPDIFPPAVIYEPNQMEAEVDGAKATRNVTAVRARQ